MVAGEAERASLSDELGAGVGIRPVADDVPEAPDVVDARLLDRVEAGLEGGQVGVDVGDHGDSQGRQGTRRHRGSYDEEGDLDRLDSRAARSGQPGGAHPPRWRRDQSGAFAGPPAQVGAGGLQLECGDAPGGSAGRSAARCRRPPPRRARARPRRHRQCRQGRGGGPGFVNLFLSDAWYRRALARLGEAGDALGPPPAADPKRILLEFVSANPTGPLHVGGGRHAAYGDSLVRLLEAVGHEVEREYYVNDGGGQVARFAASLAAQIEGTDPPEDGYSGPYIEQLAARLGEEGLDPGDTDVLGRRAVELDPRGGGKHA